jgi:F0F1-type ATP synthase delta subunit
LRLLSEHRRLVLIEFIEPFYVEVRDRLAKELTVTVTTASFFSESVNLDRLFAEVWKKTGLYEGLTKRYINKKDACLSSGAVLRFDAKVLDLTNMGALNRLLNHIKELV